MASVSKTAMTTPGQARKALASYFTHENEALIQRFAASRGLGFETAYRTLRHIAGEEFCKKGDAKRARRKAKTAAKATTAPATPTAA